MTYDGTEGKMIERPEARQLLNDYQNSPAFLANNQTAGILFGRDHIEALMSQPGCKGIRIYYGKIGVLSTSPAHMVLVGTDENGNDLTNLILDAGYPCPSYCSSASTKL